jgi:hypothetical protein
MPALQPFLLRSYLWSAHKALPCVYSVSLEKNARDVTNQTYHKPGGLGYWVATAPLRSTMPRVSWVVLESERETRTELRVLPALSDGN